MRPRRSRSMTSFPACCYPLLPIRGRTCASSNIIRGSTPYPCTSFLENGPDISLLPQSPQSYRQCWRCKTSGTRMLFVIRRALYLRSFIAELWQDQNDYWKREARRNAKRESDWPP
jgi:hypothetical protein